MLEIALPVIAHVVCTEKRWDLSRKERENKITFFIRPAKLKKINKSLINKAL